jgi:hypothetical protein
MEQQASSRLHTIAYGDILTKVGVSIAKWGFDKVKDTVWNFIHTLIDEKHKFTMALDKLDNIYNKVEKEMSVYSLLSIIKAFPDPGSGITDAQKYAEAIMNSLNTGLQNASTIKPDFEGFISKGDLCIQISDEVLVAAIIATVLYPYAYTGINPQSLALVLYQKLQGKRIKFLRKNSPPKDTMNKLLKLMIYKNDAKVQKFCQDLCYQFWSLLSGSIPV